MRMPVTRRFVDDQGDVTGSGTPGTQAIHRGPAPADLVLPPEPRLIISHRVASGPGGAGRAQVCSVPNRCLICPAVTLPVAYDAVEPGEPRADPNDPVVVGRRPRPGRFAASLVEDAPPAFGRAQPKHPRSHPGCQASPASSASSRYPYSGSAWWASNKAFARYVLHQLPPADPLSEPAVALLLDAECVAVSRPTAARPGRTRPSVRSCAREPSCRGDTSPARLRVPSRQRGMAPSKPRHGPHRLG